MEKGKAMVMVKAKRWEMAKAAGPRLARTKKSVSDGRRQGESRKLPAESRSDNVTSFETYAQSGRWVCPRSFCFESTLESKMISYVVRI